MLRRTMRFVRDDPIGERDGQRNRIREAERHDSALPIVSPRILKLDVGRREDLGREFEVESALTGVPLALRSIPIEDHGCDLRL